MMIKRMAFVLGLVVALSGKAFALNACFPTEARLLNQIYAAEVCSAVTNRRGGRSTEFCWNGFRELQPAQATGLACSAARRRPTIATDITCSPIRDEPVGTVLVCGHPGGDCSVVACCASDDGCFIYRNL